MPATQRVQRDRSSRPKALFALEAQQLLARGEARQAVELCKRGLAYYPTNPTGYVVLAQSYIQLDEKERALNVLQDGYRRTGSDRLNELALELAGERDPAPQGEPGGERAMIAEPEILTEPVPSAEEIEAGEIPIEEYPAAENDILLPAVAEEAEPLPADSAGPAPAPLEVPEPEEAIFPVEQEISLQHALLQPEEPLAASGNQEPESVEEEVIAMEIEIAEIGPEEEIAEATVTPAAEHPPTEILPLPAGPIAPESTVPAADSQPAEPVPAITPVPAAGVSPAEEAPLPEALPATEREDAISPEPEPLPATEHKVISPEPETIAGEEPGIIEPEPVAVPSAEETAPPAEAPPVERAPADAEPSIQEVPGMPPAAEAPELPLPAAPQDDHAEETAMAEKGPEEQEPALALRKPLEPAEPLAAEPPPLVELEEQQDTAVTLPAAEPAAEPAPETVPAEPAPAEPIARPDVTEPPMPEPAAAAAELETTAPLPAAPEPVVQGLHAAPGPELPEQPAEQKHALEMRAGEPPAPPETPAMPPIPEESPLSIRLRPSGGEERATAGRRENIVQLGSQQQPPLHTTEVHLPPLRTLEGKSGMETEAHRTGGAALQGTIQERPRSLALHMGKNISRLRSSNLRLIPGLEFAPLRHEDQTRKQSIAPLISEPMPMPVADPSFRTQRPLEEKEIQLPPLPPLVDAEPAPELLRIGEREPEPPAAPVQAPEPERREERIVEEPVAEELELPGWQEILEELESPATPEPAYQPEEAEGESDPFAGNIFQMVQAVQKSAELTPLEELARRLENARIPVVEEVTEHRPVFTTSIVSETLANILVSQGAFAEALKAFQTLARTKPERFDYFQERIWEMKWRMSNPDLSWPPEQEESPESADPAS